MTDIVEIQDTPKAGDFIVPADNQAKITQDLISDPNLPEAEVESEQTQEETAAAKAAAKEAFKRRKAEREASAASNEVAELRARVQELSNAKQPQAEAISAAPKRPNPADYDLGRWDAKYETDLSAYLDARENFILEQAENKARDATRSLTEAARQSQELNSLTQTADKVGERGVDKYSDFEEVVQDALEAMPPHPEALRELVRLPNAEDVFYHLAQHPDELDRITDMSPMGQALEFGKISARLAAKSKPAAVTKAKPSPQQPRGASGQFASEGDSNYDKMLKSARNPWK